MGNGHAFQKLQDQIKLKEIQPSQGTSQRKKNKPRGFAILDTEISSTVSERTDKSDQWYRTENQKADLHLYPSITIFIYCPMEVKTLWRF